MDGPGDRVISRRAVLRSISLALGILALPLAGPAQEPGRTYRLGGLFAGPRDAPQHVALFDGLRRVGFVLGQNLNVDARGYDSAPTGSLTSPGNWSKPCGPT